MRLHLAQMCYSKSVVFIFRLVVCVFVCKMVCEHWTLIYLISYIPVVCVCMRSCFVCLFVYFYCSLAYLLACLFVFDHACKCVPVYKMLFSSLPSFPLYCYLMTYYLHQLSIRSVAISLLYTFSLFSSFSSFFKRILMNFGVCVCMFHNGTYMH